MAEKNGNAVTTAKPKAATSDMRSLITGDQMKKQFMLALPKVLPVDRFLRCLVTTLNRTPELANCDRQSVLAGAMTAAQLGLEIDPALGRAYLLPYNDHKKGKIAQLIIGYKGYVDLAYRSGQMAGLQAEVVYEADEFVYEYGLNPRLRHIPADTDDHGPLKYAYAVAHLQNGGHVFRVLNRSEVMRHKASSKSAGSNYSPWTTHESEMWRKTAIRALASLLPLSPELRDAVATDDADSAMRAPVDIGEAMVMPVENVEAPETTETPQNAAEGLSKAANGSGVA